MSEGVRKVSYVVPVSREQAVEYGLVEPTPEERAEHARVAALAAVRRRTAWATLTRAQAALAAVVDPLSRSLLDLHTHTSEGRPRCEGCDVEAEQPEWPCRTVQEIARHHGIELPKPGDLW